MIKLALSVLLMLSCFACGVKGSPLPPLDHPEDEDATARPVKKTTKASPVK